MPPKYTFTKATIRTSDGREFDLKLPESIQPVELAEETRIQSIDCSSWFPETATIVGYITRVRVGPFWMRFPPPDRAN